MARVIQAPVARGSYKGVAGMYTLSLGLFWDFPTHLTLYPGSMLPERRGVLHAQVPPYIGNERMATIIDGTSNTFVVGEYASRTDPTRGSLWAVSLSFYSLSHVGPYDGVKGIPDWNTCAASLPSGFSNRCNRAFASQHPGGMNFAFCDGRERFVSKYIDTVTYMGLGTVAGAETTPDF